MLDNTDAAIRPTVPDRHEIGANGGPSIDLDVEVAKMAELVGKRVDQPIIRFRTTAAWFKFATAAELKLLDIFQGRIERAEGRLRDLRAKRTRIMNRCIKEMRRREGKS